MAGRLGLIVAAVSIPVLLIAYAVMAAHGERAVNTASVSAPGAGAEPGGWGRGGYEHVCVLGSARGDLHRDEYVLQLLGRPRW
jgi:hypothetical protein